MAEMGEARIGFWEETEMEYDVYSVAVESGAWTSGLWLCDGKGEGELEKSPTKLDQLVEIV